VCPLWGRCLAGKGERREIERWADADVIERHRARMRVAGEDMMRRRKAYGTLKRRAGAAHFRPRPVDGAARPARRRLVVALLQAYCRVSRDAAALRRASRAPTRVPRLGLGFPP
jgi:hypothetical protein